MPSRSFPSRSFPSRSLLRALAALAAALPLAACISFGPKPPPTLMALDVAAPLAPGAARTTSDGQAIAVALPTVAPALATQRVMVQAGANEIAYLKNAQWVAPPAQLFRALLAETITARTGRFVPDPRLGQSQPDTRLAGTLVAFGLDGPGKAVTVSYDAVLLHTGSTALQSRRFAARVPVASEDAAAVGAAIDRAANQVAGEIAAWIGGGA